MLYHWGNAVPQKYALNGSKWEIVVLETKFSLEGRHFFQTVSTTIIKITAVILLSFWKYYDSFRGESLYEID